MGTVNVTISWQGIDEVIARLTDIEEKGQANLQTIVRDFAGETKDAWKEGTPRGKTGRLQDEEEAVAEGLSFTLESPTFYYKFVDDPGHWTPRGWRTKHGYRPAKRRSHVEGRGMTRKATDFVKDNIEERLSHFLDGA